MIVYEAICEHCNNRHVVKYHNRGPEFVTHYKRTFTGLKICKGSGEYVNQDRIKYHEFLESEGASKNE